MPLGRPSWRSALYQMYGIRPRSQGRGPRGRDGRQGSLVEGPKRDSANAAAIKATANAMRSLQSDNVDIVAGYVLGAAHQSGIRVGGLSPRRVGILLNQRRADDGRAAGGD